ncbi:MAG: hypothetical protein ACOCUW_01865 [Gemmatimonadota bacterium]
MHDPTTETAGTATPDPAEDTRGRLFTGLDRLAFALEMEAAEAVEAGDEAAATRLEDQRLGVRMAQRFVAGVYADEVDPRIERTRSAYDRRTAGAGEVEAEAVSPRAE